MSSDDIKGYTRQLGRQLWDRYPSEVQKTRAVMRWIVNNICYDSNIKINQTAEDVIRTGRAVCAGFGSPRSFPLPVFRPGFFFFSFLGFDISI